MSHYDPSGDTATLPRLLDEYTQATASMFRPNIDEAIRLTEEIEERVARVKRYWKSRKLCLSPENSPSSPRSGPSQS